MDFSLTDEQRALADLAARIFTDRCTLARLKAVEAGDDGYDRELWAELARAGLLGAGLPESAGGSGGGFVELCLLLEQQGRRVAPVPLLETLVSAAMPLVRFGSDAQRERLLPGVVDGGTVLTAALAEPGAEPEAPRTTAAREGERWRLSGLKIAVPVAHVAAAVLVPARAAEGTAAVFLVDPRGGGVTFARQQTMSRQPCFRMELDGAAAELVGSVEQGETILRWILERATTGLCAIASGVCQEAVRVTAEYASNRKQFDKPIAMFQAVGQRMADAYIDNEAVGLTMWQAASLLADEVAAGREVEIAKYWASEGGSRIGHAALHVHGGISIDVDYPVHRYFLWAKQIENTLGAATPRLVRLGRRLAQD